MKAVQIISWEIINCLTQWLYSYLFNILANEWYIYPLVLNIEYNVFCKYTYFMRSMWVFLRASSRVGLANWVGQHLPPMAHLWTWPIPSRASFRTHQRSIILYFIPARSRRIIYPDPLNLNTMCWQVNYYSSRCIGICSRPRFYELNHQTPLRNKNRNKTPIVYIYIIIFYKVVCSIKGNSCHSRAFGQI